MAIDWNALRSALHSERSRRLGQTTAAAEVCKRGGAVMVCHNQAVARHVAATHKIKAVSLGSIEGLRGQDVPVVMDHLAAQVAIDELLAQNARLREELAKREVA